MPHMDFEPGLPGIRGPMAFSPETARPLNDLVNVLLRSNAGHPDSTLGEGERELIATFVSVRNDCFFCQTIYGAIASHHLGDADWSLVQSVKQDYTQAAISTKLKSLLAIAESGKHVTTGQIDKARVNGATDRDIHDTVLITAAFCMFNRYVDGLATWAPESPDLYCYRAQKVAEYGYTHEDHYLPPA